MTIEDLRTTLANALNIPAALYGFRGGNIKVSSLVLSITGENAYKGSDANLERIKEVSIDLYIAGADDSLADALVAELVARDIPYRLNTVIYESDTNLVHYEYIAEV